MATGLADLHNLIPRKTWPVLPDPELPVSCISKSYIYPKVMRMVSSIANFYWREILRFL